MDILPGFKLCRKGLHWYSPNPKRPGCIECKKESQKNYQLQQKKEIKIKKAKYYQDNKKRILRTNARWASQNTKRMAELRRDRYEKHKQKNLEQSRAWYRNHPEAVRLKQARKRACKKAQIPCWVNEKKIKEVYKTAELLTKTTGVQHHVDHIFPLRSDYMCGFHVETNMQILTAEENIKKSNREWPGQLDCQKGSVYAIFPKELTDLLNEQT